MTYPVTPQPVQPAPVAEKIKASSLKEGTQVFIKGRVNYSRIASFITGTERENRNRDRLHPIEFDYTSLTLSHPEIIYGNPQQKANEELFLEQRIFVGKKRPEEGPKFSIDNKSNRLPQVWVPSTNADGTYEQLEGLEGELDAGLNVIILIEFYKPRTQVNRGSRLNAVFLQEPIRYYTPGYNADKLAALGIVLNAPPKDTIQLVPNEVAAGQDQSTTDASGLPLPGQGYSAPDQPYQAQPQYQQATPAAAPQQYQAPQPQYQQSAPQAQPAPAPVAQFQQAAPQAPAQPAQQQYQAPLPAGNPLAAGQPVAPQAPLNQPTPAVQQAMPTQAPQTPAQPVQPPAPQAGSAFTDAPGAVPQAPAVQAAPAVAQAPVAPVVDMTEPASPWDLPAAPSQPAQPAQGITYPA